MQGLAGMAVFGRDAWTRNGEGFAVAFGLLARIAPFAVRDGSVVVRWPFTGLAGDERVRGTLVFIGVMLGSTGFDGFSRTSNWGNLVNDLRTNLLDSSQRVVDLAVTFLNLGGLTLVIVVILAAYLAAVAAAQALGHVNRSLVPDFVLPLVPIAAAYMVAHYFSLFIREGQFIIPLVSDPFGHGWDLFGTADYAPNPRIVERAESLAAASGARLNFYADPTEAVTGAHVVYTDAWTSMGQEAEAEERRDAFARYQVNAELMGRAGAEAVVMHCLPAHRGEEITSDVMDGPQSIILDQSENRLHVQKALLVELLGAGDAA